MSCLGCTKNFGLFLREYGCPKCKHSFCSKCLKHRVKLDGKNVDVCLKCFHLVNSKKDDAGPSKDVFSDVPKYLQEPLKPKPAVVPLTPEDGDIRNRLNALKQKDENLAGNVAGGGTTDVEMRLANLKGVEYKDYSKSNKDVLFAKDDRSEQERINDLLKQFGEEKEINEVVDKERNDGIGEIERRLAALRGDGGASANLKPTVSKENNLDISDEENEEDAAKTIAKRFLDEAEIEAKRNPSGNDDNFAELDLPKPKNTADTEELPWCVICNEDAVIRCHDCGGDLYCRGCFKEFHADEEDRNHKTVAFKAKNIE